MVTVAVAAQRTVPLTIEAIGNAQPYRTVQLKSMVDGQISRVLLRQGQDVHRGDLLFQLDKRPFQAALDQAVGKLAQDKATAAYNESQAKRDKALVSGGVIARQVLEQQQSLAQSNAATAQADEAAIEAAQVHLSYTDITAPIDARAGAILVNVGNLVQANGANPLAILNQIIPIYVQFNIPESQLAAVRAGGIGRLKVEAFPPDVSKAAVGTLTFINNSVDTSTGTLQLMGTFPNGDEKLWPGEFLNVRLLLGEEKQATVIPAAAIQAGPEGKFVYVVEKDGTAVPRPVNSPRTYRELAVIASGVEPGDQVIVSGQIKVVPNSKVQIASTVPVTPSSAQAESAEGSADPGRAQ
jgi:membrane fusion protein, multidrug efflux system